MDTPTTPDPHDDRCRADLGRCDAYRPGHALHVIHARLLGEDIRGWRTMHVSRIEGREILLVHPSGHVVLAWHHRLLTDLLAPGESVALHPRHAMTAGGVVLNVRLSGSLAQLPAADAERPRGPYVVDLSTGRGLSAPR